MEVPAEEEEVEKEAEEEDKEETDKDDEEEKEEKGKKCRALECTNLLLRSRASMWIMDGFRCWYPSAQSNPEGLRFYSSLKWQSLSQICNLADSVS